MKQSHQQTKKLVLAAIMMALYITVLFVSQSISFGAYQMRLATALYGLTYAFPFLMVPLSLANGIANIFGGLGLLDVIGGIIVGLLTTGTIRFLRTRHLSTWYIAFAIFLIPAFVAPIWLSYLLKIPYLALVLNLLVGQAVPGILGTLLVNALQKRNLMEE